MTTRNTSILIIIIILFTLGVSLAAGPLVPDKMASHWDTLGQVDGYSNKTTGLFLLPGVEVGLAMLLIFLPMIDPRKKNIRHFRPVYNVFVVVIIGFMTYIHFLTLAWNLHLITNLLRWMSPAFAILLYLCGVLISKAQPNWFIGIRTPWTLSDDRVWEKTHLAGGLTFKICGIVSLAGLIFPNAYIWLLMIPLLGSTVGLIIYSYVAYKNLHRGEA